MQKNNVSYYECFKNEKYCCVPYDRTKILTKVKAYKVKTRHENRHVNNCFSLNILI